jgi:hypothetical protein
VWRPVQTSALAAAVYAYLDFVAENLFTQKYYRNY